MEKNEGKEAGNEKVSKNEMVYFLHVLNTTGCLYAVSYFLPTTIFNEPPT